MIVYKCDLCGEVRDCVQRRIEQTEYDICSECWDALMARLKDRGRPPRERNWVTAAPVVIGPEPPREKRPAFPGQPPEITADSTNVN